MFTDDPFSKFEWLIATLIIFSYKSELQRSSFELTNECIRTSVVSALSDLCNISKMIKGPLKYIVDMMRYCQGYSDIACFVSGFDGVSSHSDSESDVIVIVKQENLSEFGAKTKKLPFICIKSEFVSSHPFSDVGQTSFNSASTRRKFHIIITTKGGIELGIICVWMKRHALPPY